MTESDNSYQGPEDVGCQDKLTSAWESMKMLARDTAIAWKKPSTSLGWNWLVTDPMSRPWYWIRYLMFIAADVSLMSVNLDSFWDNLIARYILIGVLPIQLGLIAASLYYLEKSLSRYKERRDAYLSSDESSVQDQEKALEVFKLVDEDWKIERGHIVVECFSFFADYCNLIATFYLMGTDPDELQPVSIALGYYSVIDIGLVLWSLFNDFFGQITDRVLLLRWSLLITFLIFAPVWIFSFLGYSVLLGYFVRIDQTGGQIVDGVNVTDVDNIGEDLQNEFLKRFNFTDIGEALFDASVLPGTITTTVLSVMYFIAFSIIGCLAILEIQCIPRKWRFTDVETVAVAR